ncbi:hypothetical protein MF451_003751 [Salmonella enterica subsp. enterica serovar Saintpaul]|nr:hypothetical protein [Salmonella enterica subsp. enterica serovar Saintpaul]
MLTKLYCPQCGNYLMGSDGNNHDCLCGWEQPRAKKLPPCEGCGNDDPEYVEHCTTCGAQKCDMCDMGDDVECGNCEGLEE